MLNSGYFVYTSYLPHYGNTTETTQLFVETMSVSNNKNVENIPQIRIFILYYLHYAIYIMRLA